MSAVWILVGSVLRATVRYTGCDRFPPGVLALLGYLLITLIVLMGTEIVFEVPSNGVGTLRTIVRLTALAAAVIVVSGCLAAPDCSD